MVSFEVNWLGVVLAAVVNMAIGAAWYSKSLFGKTWMHEIGMTDAKMEKAKQQGMGKLYGMAFVGSIVMAFVLANVLSVTNSDTISAAIAVAFWVWLGFMVPILLGGILWEGKSPKLFGINASYQLVALAVSAVVLLTLGL